MSSAYKVTTPVSTEPITLSEAKAWLRVDFSDEDTLITSIITRTRSLAETILHRALATQTIKQLFTLEKPTGGILSGPIEPESNWYQFERAKGANPFGPSQYYFDLAMPPIQSVSLIETRVTAFDSWATFTGTTSLDDISEPAKVYIQDPVTANFWRFTYVAGYSVSYPIPPDLLQCLYDGIAFFYNNRDAECFPDGLTMKLLARKVDWV